MSCIAQSVDKLQGLYGLSSPNHNVVNNKSIKEQRLNSFARATSYLNTKYLIGETIGKGSSGTVKKCYSNKTMQLSALKIVQMTKQPIHIQTEIKLLKKLSHPNIVRIEDVIIENNTIFLLLEYCEVDFFAFIKCDYNINEYNLSSGLDSRSHAHLIDNSNYGLSNETATGLQGSKDAKIKSYFYQICSGVEYLHKQGIVHRDLKLDNIAMKNGEIKIIDFGLAECVSYNQKENSNMVGICGSNPYLAPELVSSIKSGTTTVDTNVFDLFKCDCWALGIILITMKSKCFPWTIAHKSNNNYTTYIRNPIAISKFLSIDSQLDQQLYSLVVQMLNPFADYRLDINNIINHPWLG